MTDLEHTIVSIMKENGPLTAQEIESSLDMRSLKEISLTLRGSDKFVEDDSSRWHLTANVV